MFERQEANHMFGWGSCIPHEEQIQDQRRAGELELVRRVQAGDQNAFRDMLERYQAKVHSIIYGILRNREDTEDIAQQVFTKVYFAIKDFDCRCLGLTWTCRIAITECYTHLRNRRINIVEEPESTPEHSATESPVDKNLAAR